MPEKTVDDVLRGREELLAKVAKAIAALGSGNASPFGSLLFEEKEALLAGWEERLNWARKAREQTLARYDGVIECLEHETKQLKEVIDKSTESSARRLEPATMERAPEKKVVNKKESKKARGSKQ